MQSTTSAPDPLSFFLNDALATLGGDAAYYFGNRLGQDSPDDELLLYRGQQLGYLTQAQRDALLRGGSVAPTVSAGASTTLSGSTLLVLALVIGVVILAARAK